MYVCVRERDRETGTVVQCIPSITEAEAGQSLSSKLAWSTDRVPSQDYITRLRLGKPKQFPAGDCSALARAGSATVKEQVPRARPDLVP